MDFITESFHKSLDLGSQQPCGSRSMLLAQHANQSTKPPLKYGVLGTFCPLGLLFSRTTSQNRRFRFTFPPISLASSSICSSAPSRCSNFKQRLFGGVWWQWATQQGFEGSPNIVKSSPGVLRSLGLCRAQKLFVGPTGALRVCRVV